MRKRGLPLLGLAFLMTAVGCMGSPEPDEELSYVDEIDSVELLDNGEERVYPIMTVRIENIDQTRELFDRGEAHFEAEPFTQVSWMMDAEEPEALEYSVLTAEGTWTAWEAVEITFSEGIFHNALIALDEPARELKLRGGESIHTAELEFYEEVQAPFEVAFGEGMIARPEAPSITEEELRAMIQASVAPSSLVVSRSQWGAVQPNKVCGNVVAPYRMAIHHTAAPSNDGGDPAARMRQMQNYHMYSRGWCDIGYHFVVSQSGKIFQGRSRSDRPGAHVGNQNAGNVGISFIANFNSQTPTNLQLNTGADIIRWVHQTHGVALNRTRIKGHREHAGQTTSCPGNNMIPMIEEMISRAAQSTSQPVPSEPAPPPPEPGGCEGAVDSNAQTSFFKDYRVTATGYDDAVRLYNAGITQGCNAEPRMFCPKCALTRSQMATFLARAANLDVSNPPAQPSFSDVPASLGSYAYIEAIAAAGITNGCGNGEFCPQEEITRGQAAEMIHRAMGWPDEVAAGAPTFDDVSGDHPHYAAIETMKQRCVTNGCNGTGDAFCPEDTLSRGQAAAMIARAFNLEGSNPCAEPGGCQPSRAFGTDDSMFKDFPVGAPGYDEALLLYDAGITSGCQTSPELMFCPNCSTSRRHMIMFIARAAGLDTENPPAEPTFSDVGVDASGYGAIEAAYAAGITTGCGGDQFCPNREVSRGEVATMIARARGWTEAPPTTATFDDVPVDGPHFAGVEAIASRCVTNGCRPGEFCPTGNVPRSHAAIFIARAFNLGDINACADPDGGLLTPSRDLEGEGFDDEGEEGGGESCDLVDPEFVDASCSYDGEGDDADGDGDGADGDGGVEDGGDEDGANGDLDGGQAMVASGGCSTTEGPGRGAIGLVFMLGLIAVRRRCVV